MNWKNIEFYINPKMDKQTVYLGKHQMRFKTNLVEEFGLKDGERLRIGWSTEEKPQKHLYIVKAKENETGFLFIARNKSYMIAFKGLFDKLQILKPTNARYSIHEDEGTKYIKIYLPKYE